MITGVVLARNEALNIVACLQALRPHVDEMLLIDMESSDETVKLAATLVDKVLHHPLVAEFDGARNLAIPEAKYDWLWFIDADERVPAPTGQLVRKLILEQGDQFEAIIIPFKSYFCGQWMQHCGWWPGYTMPRVLKRGKFRFVERLHGGVQVDGRQIRLTPDPSLAIDHYSYRSVEHYVEKLNRYTSTESGHLFSQGARWDWRDALREMVRDLWMYYEHNPGHKDSERGWILSWLSGQYRWLARAKLIDRTDVNSQEPPPPGGTAPGSLDEVLDLWQRELSALRAHYPKLPLGIVWRSPVWDPSGYADEARCFLKGICHGSRHLRAEEIRWNDQLCELPFTDARLLRALVRAERPAHCAAVTECIPTLVEPDPHAALNIIRTMFETDRLPEGWTTQLAKFDEVWVPSQHNYRAFRRSGVPPEKLRVVPSCLDTDVFRPDGPSLELPTELAGRFVFLSVFDWQLRKGWDLLLRAFCQEFSTREQVGLLCKITRAHGHSHARIRAQIDEILGEFGQSLVHRPDIVIWDSTLSVEQMAALYRGASAFVLPSRGEGWGRPYMEAMACGLPVIGTSQLGSADFLTQENSYLIDASLVAVPEAAAREIPPYRGHRWHEPDLGSLRQQMRRVYVNATERTQVVARAVQEVSSRYSLSAGGQAVEKGLAEAEHRFASPALPSPSAGQTRVVLEGEFFALHSFSNINEVLALQFAGDSRLALSLQRVEHQPTFDASVPHAWKLRNYFRRPLGQPPDVTIRHAFPPNWEPVSQGLWVHIQPWEFGHLPVDWIEPLTNDVDEVWAPSNYVRKVYERSGIPAEKIRVIPWGLDHEIFAPTAEPLLVPTDKSFKFLFVGGTIRRKGIDILLEAYLNEFNAKEDVCLVIKDMGTQSYYRYGNMRERILAARGDPGKASIVYLEDSLTTGQMASLYTACDSLAAPYRAEGFGLPILEAMGCGLAPIVPRGGASDDFTSAETAYLLPSREVETEFNLRLTGPALELSISVDDVRKALRQAYEDRERTRRLGKQASEDVRARFTWRQTAETMVARMVELTHARSRESNQPLRHSDPRGKRSLVAACIVAKEAHQYLAGALAKVTPFVDDTIVVLEGASTERSEAIIKEYGARLVFHEGNGQPDLHGIVGQAVTDAEWVFWLNVQDRCLDFVERIRPLVATQPADVSELVLDIPNGNTTARSLDNRGELRIVRQGQAVKLAGN